MCIALDVEAHVTKFLLATRYLQVYLLRPPNEKTCCKVEKPNQ
jgi:hypothetical protein